MKLSGFSSESRKAINRFCVSEAAHIEGERKKSRWDKRNYVITTTEKPMSCIFIEGVAYKTILEISRDCIPVAW